MKNKQLFIMALLVVFGGMTFASQSVEQDKIKKETEGLELLKNKTLSSGSFIYMNCEENYGEDCSIINNMLVRAHHHLLKKKEIVYLEYYLKETSSKYAQIIMRDLLIEKKEAYPNYDKLFRDIVSEEDASVFSEALRNELLKINIYKMANIYKIANEAEAIGEILNC